jgi:hypothetical protein
MFSGSDTGSLLQGRADFGRSDVVVPRHSYIAILLTRVNIILPPAIYPTLVGIGIGIKQYWISNMVRFAIIVARNEMGGQNKLAPYGGVVSQI